MDCRICNGARRTLRGVSDLSESILLDCGHTAHPYCISQYRVRAYRILKRTKINAKLTILCPYDHCGKDVSNAAEDRPFLGKLNKDALEEQYVIMKRAFDKKRNKRIRKMKFDKAQKIGKIARQEESSEAEMDGIGLLNETPGLCTSKWFELIETLEEEIKRRNEESAKQREIKVGQDAAQSVEMEEQKEGVAAQGEAI